MKDSKISMSKADLLKEHRKLIKILLTGTASQRKKEAKDQAKEMKMYVKK